MSKNPRRNRSTPLHRRLVPYATHKSRSTPFRPTHHESQGYLTPPRRRGRGTIGCIQPEWHGYLDLRPRGSLRSAVRHRNEHRHDSHGNSNRCQGVSRQHGVESLLSRLRRPNGRDGQIGKSVRVRPWSRARLAFEAIEGRKLLSYLAIVKNGQVINVHGGYARVRGTCHFCVASAPLAVRFSIIITRRPKSRLRPRRWTRRRRSP